jgi:hypothetical protein
LLRPELSVGRFVILGFVLFVVLSASAPVRAQQATSIGVKIAVQTRVVPQYDAYGYGLSEVNATVTSVGPISITQSLPVELLPSFLPVSLSVQATVNGSLTNLPCEVLSGTFGINVDFTLPKNTSTFTVTMQGSQSGSSFLWRYVTGIPFVATGSGLSLEASSSTLLLPRGTVVSQVYNREAQLPLPVANSTGLAGGEIHYDVGSFQGSLFVIQSSSYLPLSIAFTVAALAVMVLAALNLFGQGRSFIHSLANGLSRRLLPPISSLRRRLVSSNFRIRNLFQPRRLLALFILCALVMVSLAAVSGPDPRLKAYVIANPSNVGGISLSLSSVSGNVVVITPAEDYSDFGVMSSVGEINVIVVSNYQSTLLPEIEGFVVPNLGNVPVVVYDNSANVSFVSQIKDLHASGSILHVQNAANLNGTEREELTILLSSYGALRHNSLGLSVSVDGFDTLLAVEGALSFVLVFIGFAYLGSLTSESGSRSELSNLVAVLASGIFVFVFSEVIYVTTSSLLAFPLSLHAVITGAHGITAVGLLGFGGGSTPRLAAGVLGVIVGAVAVEGGLKVRGPDAALVCGAVLVLLANPLSIGQYVFQALMAFIGPTTGARYSFGIASANILTLKGFLYGIGTFFAGSVTPQYLMSAGKILFFAGLVPLAYLKKMGRTTTVLALIVVAIIMGQGGIRIGEMTPDKTFIAIVPGVVAGFVIAAVLLALALLERYARGNWRSSA